MKKLRIAITAIITLAITIALIGTSHVKAEPFDLVAEQGLQVSPAMVELNAEPGKSYVLDISLLNVANTQLNYDVEYFDFKSKNESGTPDVYADDSLPPTASVRSWFTIEDSLKLDSYQKKPVRVKVDVPKNAEPGGHYGVISFTNGAPNAGDDEKVAVQVKTGVLVLIRVAGDIKESLSVDSFTASSKNSTPFFIENAPIDFTVRLRNTGNVHVRPQGSIEVRNMLGGLVGKTDFNKSAGNILPGSIRKLQASLNSDWMIGRYTASLTAGYGTNGQALLSETTFWVIPYKPLLAILAGILTVIFIIRMWLRSYKKHIIEETEEDHHYHDESPEHEQASKQVKVEDNETKSDTGHENLHETHTHAGTHSVLTDEEIEDLFDDGKPKKQTKKSSAKKPK